MKARQIRRYNAFVARSGAGHIGRSNAPVAWLVLKIGPAYASI